MCIRDRDIGYKSGYSMDWASWYSGISVNNTPQLQDYASFRPFVRVGCSGHPVFCLVNNELALLGCYFSASAGSSVTRSDVRTAVNAAMTTLGGGYQLTNVDLSGFPTY